MNKTTKKIVKPKTYSAEAMYTFYKKKHPETDITYWMFKEVISRFNKKASSAIIFGSALNIGSKLGLILIKKIRRNYTKPKPDWGVSNKRKKELIEQGITPKDQNNPNGEEWITFYTDPWYLRWAWVKKRICRVKNQTVYKFMPTANRSKTAGDTSLEKLGNKGKLVLANKLNPTLHVIYEQVNKFD